MTATGCGVVSIPNFAHTGKPTYTNGDILGGRKEPIDEDTHEGRVQTELDIQVSQLGVGHALRDDNGADGDACEE
jgi:hypothetical protein